METLEIIGLSILGIILIIGIIRLIFAPEPNGSISEFFMDLFLIDWFGDLFEWVAERIGDLLDND